MKDDGNWDEDNSSGFGECAGLRIAAILDVRWKGREQRITPGCVFIFT